MATLKAEELDDGYGVVDVIVRLDGPSLLLMGCRQEERRGVATIGSYCITRKSLDWGYLYQCIAMIR